MKERPVIFNSEMVRAILSGRKTQTRRIVKSDCMDIGEKDDGSRWPWREHDEGGDYWYPCPFGQVGDRLWVRETFMDLTGTGIEATTGKFEGFAYRANTPAGSYGDEVRKEYGLKWTPSLHMPRKACRILLEITAVRVERLNDISEEDAKAEGVAPSQHIITPPEALYRVGFLKLWQSIYGEERWRASPWVWVIEFRRVEVEK